MFCYHCSDFLPLAQCVKKKVSAKTAISVVIPTRNEVATIGRIVATAKKELMEKTPLVDEIIVMDGNSSDGTVQAALNAGAKVLQVDDVSAAGMPVYGKGAAIWKSLFSACGDIIVCIDADILNFGPHFIYGLIGPFLENKEILFAKAYYKRPLKIGASIHENYGGRVTEILVRPLLSAFVPDLAKLFQPLSGEYAFLRKPVESIPFSSGYGVEIGIIFDLYKKYGLHRFAQVDMGTRYHRNRPVNELGKMAFGIVQTMLRKLEREKALTLNVPFGDIMISPVPGGMEETVVREIELPPKAFVNEPACLREGSAL